MRDELHRAYVLHRRPFRESSLLLEVFSQDTGRLALVARGVQRTARQNKSGLLQAFTPLLLSWSGRGELLTLTHVETGGRSHNLTGSALLSAFYLNELIMRLLQPHDPNEDVFGFYRQALQDLEAQPHPIAWTLRLFEKRLLQALGYGLLLEHEAQRNTPIDPAGLYHYVLQHGPVQHAGGERMEPLVQGSTLLALAAEYGADERSLIEARNLMRAVLSRYLGPRPLRSRELFRQLQVGRVLQPKPANED